MEHDVLARFERIAANMACDNESLVNGELVRKDGHLNRDSCNCPHCKFRRMIARVKADYDLRHAPRLG